MSDIFSWRWKKKPDELEEQAKDAITRWQEENRARQEIFRAVVIHDGKEPVSVDHKLDRLEEILQKISKKLGGN